MHGIYLQSVFLILIIPLDPPPRKRSRKTIRSKDTLPGALDPKNIFRREKRYFN